MPGCCSLRGDGRLAEEPPPRRLVQLVGADPLERHRAVQLLLMGGEHFPQAALRVVPLAAGRPPRRAGHRAAGDRTPGRQDRRPPASRRTESARHRGPDPGPGRLRSDAAARPTSSGQSAHNSPADRSRPCRRSSSQRSSNSPSRSSVGTLDIGVRLLDLAIRWGVGRRGSRPAGPAPPASGC